MKTKTITVNDLLQEFMDYFKQNSWHEVTDYHKKCLGNYLATNDIKKGFDVATIFREVFSYELNMAEILSQSNLDKVANEILAYYENVWLPMQVNFIYSFEEYHNNVNEGLVAISYNHKSKVLSFGDKSSSYFMQYVNETHLMGNDKASLMEFILANGKNKHDLQRFIGFSIASQYGYSNMYAFEDIFTVMLTKTATCKENLKD